VLETGIVAFPYIHEKSEIRSITTEQCGINNCLPLDLRTSTHCAHTEGGRNFCVVSIPCEVWDTDGGAMFHSPENTAMSRPF
jgi:hypothetical protein